MPWSSARLYTNNTGMYSSGQHQDHTTRGRNKPQSCQSHLLSLGLPRKTFSPAEDGAFLQKHETIDHIRRAWTVVLFIFHCLSAHFFPLLSFWMISFTFSYFTHQKDHQESPPLQPEEKREQCFGDSARQSCRRQRGGADPSWPWQHQSLGWWALPGSSCPSGELWAAGAAPQPGVTLDTNRMLYR